MAIHDRYVPYTHLTRKEIAKRCNLTINQVNDILIKNGYMEIDDWHKTPKPTKKATNYDIVWRKNGSWQQGTWHFDFDQLRHLFISEDQKRQENTIKNAYLRAQKEKILHCGVEQR